MFPASYSGAGPAKTSWDKFQECFMKKFFAAATVLVISFSVAMAEEFTASISKVDGSKVTLTKRKKGEKGEETTLTATDDVKVVKAKFNKETKKLEAGDAIE